MNLSIFSSNIKSFGSNIGIIVSKCKFGLSGGNWMFSYLNLFSQSVMEDKENVTLASTPMTPQAMSTELNVSARGTGTPIRPLTAAYAASRSEYEVRCTPAV